MVGARDTYVSKYPKIKYTFLRGSWEGRNPSLPQNAEVASTNHDDDGDDNDDEDGLPSNSQPPYSHQTSKSKVGKKCDKNCLKTPQKLTKRLILLIVTHFSCAKFSFT